MSGIRHPCGQFVQSVPCIVSMPSTATVPVQATRLRATNLPDGVRTTHVCELHFITDDDSVSTPRSAALDVTPPLGSLRLPRARADSPTLTGQEPTAALEWRHRRTRRIRRGLRDRHRRLPRRACTHRGSGCRITWVLSHRNGLSGAVTACRRPFLVPGGTHHGRCRRLVGLSLSRNARSDDRWPGGSGRELHRHCRYTSA